VSHYSLVTSDDWGVQYRAKCYSDIDTVTFCVRSVISFPHWLINSAAKYTYTESNSVLSGFGVDWKPSKFKKERFLPPIEDKQTDSLD